MREYLVLTLAGTFYASNWRSILNCLIGLNRLRTLPELIRLTQYMQFPLFRDNSDLLRFRRTRLLFAIDMQLLCIIEYKKKLAFWIVDLALWNSFILYKKCSGG